MSLLGWEARRKVREALLEVRRDGLDAEARRAAMRRSGGAGGHSIRGWLLTALPCWRNHHVFKN